MMVEFVQIQVNALVNDVDVENDKPMESQLCNYLEVLVHVNDDIHEVNLKQNLANFQDNQINFRVHIWFNIRCCLTRAELI
jgi:hypothetical protein